MLIGNPAGNLCDKLLVKHSNSRCISITMMVHCQASQKTFKKLLCNLKETWLKVSLCFRLTHCWTSVSLHMVSCRSGGAQTAPMTKCLLSHRPLRGPGKPNQPVCCCCRSEEFLNCRISDFLCWSVETSMFTELRVSLTFEGCCRVGDE